MLFSATQTRRVEDLARISLKKEPLYVGVDDNKDNATVDGLEQVLSDSFDLCPLEVDWRLRLMFCSLRAMWCARQRNASCCSSPS